MSKFAPKAHLTAPVFNWAPIYRRAVEQVQAGEWKPESIWIGLEAGVVDLSPMGSMVPKDVQDKVMAKKEAIIAGEKVFVGPIMDQAGNEKVAAGQAMTDGDMLGMTWFVQGVVGTIE
jgi:basic membrane protein A